MIIACVSISLMVIVEQRSDGNIVSNGNTIKSNGNTIKSNGNTIKSNGNIVCLKLQFACIL